MTGTRALVIAAMLLVVAPAARAQTPCDAPNALVERLYIEVSGAKLDSVSVDLGKGALPMTKDSREYRWVLDLWNAAIVQPLPASELAKRMKKPGTVTAATGWTLKPHPDPPVARNEPIGNASRCVAVFTYAAAPVWRVRVDAVQGGTTARPVLMLCRDLKCDPRASILVGGPPGSRARTSFDSQQIEVDAPLRMGAAFTSECTVELTVTFGDLPKKAFTRRMLYENLPNSCMRFLSLLPRAIADQFVSAFLQMPDSIAVNQLLPTSP